MDEPDQSGAERSDERAASVRALILAAGEGTRLRPLTLTRPKPMVPIGGRPILEHLLALLQHHGMVDIAINLHYKHEAITEYFGDGAAFGARIVYSHEARLLGSAGAAKRLEWFLDRTFVVLYGDVLTDVDLGALIREHRRRRALVTALLHEVPDPERQGIAELAPDGRITRFMEKPPPESVFSYLASAGVYVLEPAVLSCVPPEEPFDFGRDVFPQLVEQAQPIFGHTIHGCYILDIGSPERFAQAGHDFKAGIFRSFAGL